MHTRIKRIDIHHHFFPKDVDKTKASAKAGWRVPYGSLPWDPQVSLRAMDASSVDVTILSMPATPHGSPGHENRSMTRSHNLQAAAVCAAYPTRFGLFASLPFLDDVEGALAEIDYALDELNADGISLSSSYGEGEDAKYVGDLRYEPIWKELDRRRAVVFLHGAQIPSSTPYPHEFLGLPITEVPNETFKAASHLVVTGMKRKYPNVKIILAHLGGSTPWLAPRVAVLSTHMGCALTPSQILEDFKSFYFDTALSAYETNLTAMSKFVKPNQILFGTDCPAVSPEMAKWYTDNLESFYADDPRSLQAIMAGNALRLFPRLRTTRESAYQSRL